MRGESTEAVSALRGSLETNQPTEKNPADARRQLRMAMLTTPAKGVGIQPTKSFRGFMYDGFPRQITGANAGGLAVPARSAARIAQFCRLAGL